MLAALTLCAAPAAAQHDALAQPTRVRVIANGAWSNAASSFSETRSFTEFAETATLKSSYSTKSGIGGDIGLQVSLLGRLGVFAAVTFLDGDVLGSYEASLPHPLYLAKPRSLSGDLAGALLHKTQRGLHVDLAFAETKGHVDYGLFAGASFTKVEADLVDKINYTSVYPYDVVTLNRLDSARATDSPIGVNVGGRLDYRFGAAGRFGLGVQVRVTTGNAKLKLSDGRSVSVSAGGVQAGAGARLYF